MLSLFRCYSVEEKMWLFNDVSLDAAELPNWLNMRFSRMDNYPMTMATGRQDIRGINIYEKDVIKYKESVYRVIYDAPAFVFECMNGELTEEIPAEECEIVGNSFDSSFPAYETVEV